MPFNDHVIRYYLFYAWTTNGSGWKIWRDLVAVELEQSSSAVLL